LSFLWCFLNNCIHFLLFNILQFSFYCHLPGLESSE
jgi:hypothetical protein